MAAFVASFNMTDKTFAKCAKRSRKRLAGTAAKPTSDKGLQTALMLGMCTVMENMRAAETLDEVVEFTNARINLRAYAHANAYKHPCTHAQHASVLDVVWPRMCGLLLHPQSSPGARRVLKWLWNSVFRSLVYTMMRVRI